MNNLPTKFYTAFPLNNGVVFTVLFTKCLNETKRYRKQSWNHFISSGYYMAEIKS